VSKFSSLIGRSLDLARRARRRLRAVIAPGPTAPPPLEPVRLRLIPEDAELVLVTDVAAFESQNLPSPGAIGRLVDSDFGPAEISPPLRDRVGGSEMPDWTRGTGAVLKAGVNVSRVKNVHYMPSFGAVIDQDGRLFRSTVQEALYFTPTLGGLPNVGADEEGARFWPPANPPSTPAGTVFVTWGGLHNYGHFLLDCLPALAASQAAGLLDRFPAIAPALNRWQRQLVNVAFGADLPLTTLDTPIAHVGEVVFSNCMDHFLHSPNAPLDRVREGALSRVADRAGAGKRLYVTRRGDQKRRLVNEGELEAALVARGFQVVQPEELDVFDQVALFRDAEVVVAPTGAALANCLFQGPDTKVFEIMPTNFTGVWVRGVCELFSIRWHGYFCPSPLAEDEVFIEGVRREGVLFNWRIELPDFLTFLDARL
jgi:capsular polysaccharide biosynthesis protein